MTTSPFGIACSDASNCARNSRSRSTDAAQSSQRIRRRSSPDARRNRATTAATGASAEETITLWSHWADHESKVAFVEDASASEVAALRAALERLEQ